MAKQPIVAALFCLLLAALGASFTIQITQAQSSPPVWAQVLGRGLIPAPSAPNHTIRWNSVFTLNANDVWVAGGEYGDDIKPGVGLAYRYHWTGAAWILLAAHRLRAPLNAIAAVSEDNVWAVGDEGLISHKDVSGWNEVSNPLPNSNLTTIQMLGNGEEGWAGGLRAKEDAALLHYRDGAWTVDSSLSANLGVSALHFAPGGGWAVGGYHIWHYDGDKWVADTDQCRPAGCDSLTAVRAISSGEAWVAGFRQVTAGGFASGPAMLILHRTNGSWQDVSATLPLVNAHILLTALSFSSDGFGIAVGAQDQDYKTFQPLILSYPGDGNWHVEQVPQVTGTLTSVSQADRTHALAVGSDGLILSYGYASHTAPAPVPTEPLPVPTTPPGQLPTTRVPDPHIPGVIYFDLVGHTLRGGFRTYWEEHGGLPQFGYPITEEFQEVNRDDGKAYTTQYFERARFEWHPENKQPNDILLGLLGREVTQSRQGEPPFQPAPLPPLPDLPNYFPQTRHNMAPQFADYWRTHGGLPIYGYPISEPFMAASSDGKHYLAQYFERNRLEYHPELPEPYRVSLGLLGVDLLRAKDWIP